MTNDVPASDLPEITDLSQRQQAIDPLRSCIVQAPAGSGKTTLLSQRYVSLLAGVDQPEQILAITFTKKAAAEMRVRIRQELADPDSPLGKAAMARSAEKSWGIDRYPSRMRIQTIDAFAMSLVKQLPVTSKLQQRDICSHPDEYYQRAVARVVNRIAQPNDASAAIHLLREFDGNTVQVQNLLITMLRRREQWLFSLTDHLANLTPETLVDAISEGIADLQADALASLLDNISLPVRHKLQEFARYASDNLGETTAFSDLSEFEQWRFIATNLVLIASASLEKPQVRRSLNKNNGFPAAQDNEHKQDLLALLGDFSADERYTDMLQSLTAIRDIPQMNAATRDRDRLTVIGTMLLNCVAELNELFDEQGEVDYNQITIAAITALGTDDAPTELAMSLDYRISHLLIDEFQDTSRAQHTLFERLISQWTPEDNTTFFAVGDPMQSIYRFRNAEVSLFLEVCANGIGNLTLDHLQLSTNFRSSDTMISWFNQVFAAVLGGRDDTNLGRISYAQASSPRGALAALTEAELHEPLQLSETVAEQHEQIIAHIEALRSTPDTPLTSIAILVRNRTPVAGLVQALEAADIEWQGTDLYGLAETAIVSDLVALANTLFDPADKTSTFAFLRSPLVGLSLHDLFAFAQHLEDDRVPHVSSLIDLADSSEHSESVLAVPDVSQQGNERLQRFIAVARQPLKDRLQLAPRELIETVWFQLGGPAAYAPTQLKHAERLLDTIEQGHPTHFSAPQLRQDINKLYAEDDGTGVQILTVHKSKGLQYRHVLLPHLEAGTRADEAALMLQRASPQGVLLACKASNQTVHFDKKNKTVYYWLKLEDAQRARNETRRVLYVAATRAEQTLKLFASMPPDKNSATAGSLLSCLDVVFGDRWQDKAVDDARQKTPTEVSNLTAQSPDQDQAERKPIVVQALPAALHAPELPPPGVTLPKRSRNIAGRRELDEPELLFALERRAAILRGNLTHQALCTLTQAIPNGSPTGLAAEVSVANLIETEHPLWSQAARQLGLNEVQTRQLTDTVAKQLERTAGSALGRWCALAPQLDSQAEIGLTLWENAGPLALVVDRMFVTENPRERWIIDYKTASPESGADVAGSSRNSPHPGADNWLVDELKRYAQQLSRYARAVRAIHPETAIRTALYFTATDELWETGINANDATEADIPVESAGYARRLQLADVST